MGTKERREREKEETRRLIMDAARRLFVEHGYGSVSMRKIADAIEYSPASVYVHFKDKEDLIRVMCQEDFGKLDAEALSLAGIADPIKRIAEIGRRYVHFGVANPHHYKLMFMTEIPVKPDKEQLAEMDDPSKSSYALLRLAVVEAKAAGRLRDGLKDVDLVTQMLWAGVHGVTSLLIVMKNDPCVKFHDADGLTEMMVSTLIRGMLGDDSKSEPTKKSKVVKHRMT